MREHAGTRHRKVVVGLLGLSALVLSGLGSLEVAGAQAEVTELNGSAYGAYVSVGLFGGPPNQVGPTPVVVLPPGGGNETDSIPELIAQFGPASVFAGHWPEDAPNAPPSGPLTVSTEGEIGPDAYVTSSATAVEVGPGPLIADELRSTCTADGDGVTGSATVVDGIVETSYDPETQLPATFEDIPENPAPNTVIEGMIDHVGDRFRIVFNEQIVDGDTITVRAAHVYLLGDIAVGDMIVGQSVCGLSADDGSTAPPTTAPGSAPPPTAPLPDELPDQDPGEDSDGETATEPIADSDDGLSPVVVGGIVVAGGLGLAAAIALARRRGREEP